MKKNAFSTIELLITLAIFCAVAIAIPNMLKKSEKPAQDIPKIDYDCITIGDMMQNCDIYVDGKYYDSCDYNELPGIIEKLKKGNINYDEI